MKMRIFMRFLLTLYILFVLFISGAALACTWGIIQTVHPEYWLGLLYGDNTVRFVVSVILVAVIVLSILLMFSGIKKRKPKSALINQTGNGTISISLSAIEEMATRHIAANEAVRSVKAFVSVKDSKVNISAKLAVAEGTQIPDILLTLQTSLKENIELLSGIEVNKILLLVEKTSQVVKARVE
ncbi:MAG: alkaline shock response membrane anchor protein AmaP [Eubacteriales bacterium]|nr:alkaline shock response membrane anchor protein AmaP [Eubacteriales bacterium]